MRHEEYIKALPFRACCTLTYLLVKDQFLAAVEPFAAADQVIVRNVPATGFISTRELDHRLTCLCTRRSQIFGTRMAAGQNAREYGAPCVSAWARSGRRRRIYAFRLGRPKRLTGHPWA